MFLWDFFTDTTKEVSELESSNEAVEFQKQRRECSTEILKH